MIIMIMMIGMIMYVDLDLLVCYGMFLGTLMTIIACILDVYISPFGGSILLSGVSSSKGYTRRLMFRVGFMILSCILDCFFILVSVYERWYCYVSECMSDGLIIVLLVIDLLLHWLCYFDLCGLLFVALVLVLWFIVLGSYFLALCCGLLFLVCSLV